MDVQILSKIQTHFASSNSIEYAKGHILALPHQEFEGVYFLREGAVEQYDITPEGNKIVVNIFKPPAFFPMSWAINKTTNTYFFEALTNITVQRASAESTVEFLRTNPDVTFDLLSRVYRGTDALLRRLAVTASGIAANRLIFELIIEAYRFGTQLDNEQRKVVIKQTVLASRSGLARETVSRELRKLETEQVVHQAKDGLVLNMKQLEAKLDIGT